MLVLVSGMPLVCSGAERRVHSLSQYVQCCLLIPPLTSLQNSSVSQTPCPLPIGAAVGADAGAVDPPTQGAVQGVDLCVETWIVLGT